MDCDLIAEIELLEQPNVSHYVGIYEDDDSQYKTGSLVVVKLNGKLSLGYICKIYEVDDVANANDIAPGMVGLVNMDVWKAKQEKAKLSIEGNNFQDLFASILQPLLGTQNEEGLPSTSTAPVTPKKSPSYSIHISILPMEGGYDE